MLNLARDVRRSLLALPPWDARRDYYWDRLTETVEAHLLELDRRDAIAAAASGTIVAEVVEAHPGVVN
jgi:hypothetical protein